MSIIEKKGPGVLEDIDFGVSVLWMVREGVRKRVSDSRSFVKIYRSMNS